MSSTVIKVENLSKQYRLGDVGTGALAHDINKWWYKIRGKENPYLKIGETNDRTQTTESQYTWALKDIDFEVKRGEVLGIIGRNGAGKSTLLKILSRTTLPTVGKIKLKGRVASLLEVGTGFHPELTGRANIFLNGAIMGMSRRDILNRFDEIVSFAGVERYIDTPVKRYSSGMYVRLAFGVAAHLEPDILIVDEVLAVGDAEFQAKAIGKIKEVSDSQGRTVLFVSHDLANINKLTGSCLLLTNGKMSMIGATNDVVHEYLSRDLRKEQVFSALPLTARPNVISAELLTGGSQNIHQFGAPLTFRFVLNFPKPLEAPAFSFQVFNSSVQPVLNFACSEESFRDCKGNVTIVCEIPAPRLYKGKYMISAYLGDQRSKEHFESVEFICPFEIIMMGGESNLYLDNVCAYIETSHWAIR